MVKNQRQGWAVWARMFVMFLRRGRLLVGQATATRILHQQLGVDRGRRQHGGQGGALRHLQLRALRQRSPPPPPAARSTRCTTRSRPLGGLVPLFNIQLGEVIFGGVGAGLYGMLVFAVVAVFVAGLMVGRTPEYLGKKIEAYDMKMASLSLLVLCRLHPRLHGLGACVAPTWRPAGAQQRGPARLQRDPLRLLLGRRQQRQRLRRPLTRQHASATTPSWASRCSSAASS